MSEENNNNETLNELLKAENRTIPEDIFENKKTDIIKPKRKTWVNVVLIVLTVILIAAISVAVVILVKFNKTIDRTPVSSEGNKIGIDINSLNGVDENGQVKYDIFFTNTEDKKMKDVSLSVRFPSEFSYVNSNIDPDFMNDEYIKWDLGELDPNDTKVLSLEGVLFGEVGTESVISAVMDYGFEGISATFRSVNSYSIGINKAIYDVIIERDDIFYKDQEFKYTIKVKNNTAKALKNVKLSLDFYGDDFNVKSYSEEPTENYGSGYVGWTFDMSKKQETEEEYFDKIIEITGVVEKDNVDTVGFAIKSGVKSESAVNNVEGIDTIFYKEDYIKTSAAGLNFVINANGNEINKDENALISVNADKEFEIAFKYNKLSEDAVFKDLRLNVEFLGDNIIDTDMNFGKNKPEISEIKDDKSSNIILEWNGNNYKDFKDIGTEEKELKFSFKINKDLLKNYKEDGFLSNVRVNLYGKNTDKDKEITIIGDRKFKVAIDTDLKVTTSTSNTGLKAGETSGPVEISYKIKNTYNKLSGFGITFLLPENVEYTMDNALSRSVRDEYNAENRKIVWVIGDVNPGDEITGKFFVNVTPAGDSKGKNVDLAKDINITFKDITINKDFSIGIEPIISSQKVK